MGFLAYYFLIGILVKNNIFKLKYMKIMQFILFSTIIFKIILDFVHTKYEIVLSSCLIPIITTYKLYISILYVFLMNLTYVIIFLVRLIIGYYKMTLFNEEYYGENLTANIALTKFYAVWSVVLFIISIFIISIY